MNSSMRSLFKKEITIFFGSLTGYIVVLVFILASGLFLWIFPGNYNILDNGYATLDGLFSLAPWLYLFLIPALTMRMFAEEKRLGTLETLITKPIGTFSVVFTKYLAGLVLVLFSLLPTLCYYASVYWLGSPVGNMDTGGTWGAFIGLFFLAAVYTAIGLFASALAATQVVSFLVAMVLSFVFYIGFELIGSSGVPYFPERLLTWLSINEHYLSISRGVLTIRDIGYFTGLSALFLVGTVHLIRPRKQASFRSVFMALRVPVLIVLLMVVSSNFLYRIDLTRDKRYSLAAVSKSVLQELQYDADVEFYLDGELQPGLRRLQQAVVEKVVDMNTWSSRRFRMRLIDPYAISHRARRDTFIRSLMERGIRPTSFRQNTEQGVVTKMIFPGALIRYGDKELAVNFLRDNPAFTGEVNLNHSIENIEYALIHAFRKLMVHEKPVLAFLEGHGELNRYEVGDLSASLAGEFEVTGITARDLALTPENFHLLIIAGPVQPFSETDKLAVDQYIMQGGRVMWLIDPVQVSLDSLQNGFMTVAFPRNLNLDDQLFRYGVRLNYDLLQDVSCSRLRVNTALPGNPPRFTTEPWYYSPLLTPNDHHEIGRNLNQVMAEFVSSMDTLSAENIDPSVILTTSPNARRVKTPAEVSLEMINMPPDRRLFTESFIPTGVLLEGTFPSVFKNRMVDEWNSSGKTIRVESPFTKMMVFSDASLIANTVEYRSGQPVLHPLGFDRVSGFTFGNKEFITNAIYYLSDSRGIMQLRNRTIKLRLLDKVRIREEKRFWQLVNLLVPAFWILIFGVVYFIVRKRRIRHS
jgi:ABC-2 type transport system permease protein